MFDELRMEGMVLGFAIMSLGFYFLGCTPKKDVDELRSELEQAKLDLQVLNSSSGHNHALAAVCREELTTSLETLKKTCALADEYLHQVMEYPFEGTRTLTDVPCRTSVPIQVSLQDVDTKNEWAYLEYVVDGEQRLTDPLIWGKGFQGDRNTIRVATGKVEEVIFLTVHDCANKDSCRLSCFAFEPPSGHFLTCGH